MGAVRPNPAMGQGACRVNKHAFIQGIAGRSALSNDQAPPQTLLDAVRENLALLLNTRRGAVEHLPDYGMPPLETYQPVSPESMTALTDELETTLREYEPRIQGLRVSLSPSGNRDFFLSIEIDGTVKDEIFGEHKVEIKTMVSENGRAEVES